MIPNEQYKQDMFDGIIAAFFKKTISVEEAGRLRISVKEDVDLLRMFVDTNKRLGRIK